MTDDGGEQGSPYLGESRTSHYHMLKVLSSQPIFLFTDVFNIFVCLRVFLKPTEWAYLFDLILIESDDKQANIIDAFNTTSRYLGDIFNINNVYFETMVS